MVQKLNCRINSLTLFYHFLEKLKATAVFRILTRVLHDKKAFRITSTFAGFMFLKRLFTDGQKTTRVPVFYINIVDVISKKLIEQKM